MKGIGILPGYRPSEIDHIVPLCSVLGIPLLVTNPTIHTLISFHYPPLTLLYADPEDRILDELLYDYDLFVYVHFYRRVGGHFLFDDYLLRKKGRSVISLHGNPDKFHDIFWLENLADEDIVLAYGPQLASLMAAKGIKKTPLICGNYRFEYYQEHKNFFAKNCPFKKEKTTLLYAPTWSAPNRKIEHRKYYSSFFSVYQELFETLPEDFQLIVKLHPFLTLLMFDEIEKIKHHYPHIHFLDDYPPIYPLLKESDIYLGDYSSIGYDFLAFDRPLFFLAPERKTPLQQCGVRIGEGVPIYETIKTGLSFDFQEKRKGLYHEAFGKQKPLGQLRREIESAY